MTPRASNSISGGDAIVGYRTFVAVIAAAYVTLIALTPRTAMTMMQEVSWARLLPLCGLYLLLGISGFDYARRRGSLPMPRGRRRIFSPHGIWPTRDVQSSRRLACSPGSPEGLRYTIERSPGALVAQAVRPA